jgi:hypothetical protein
MVTFCTGPDFYDKGKTFLKDQSYDKAKEAFSYIKQGHAKYDSAQMFIRIADSLIAEDVRKEFIRDSINKVINAQKEIENEIKNLEYIIESIKSFNGYLYQSDVPSLMKEVDQFKDWAGRAIKARKSEDGRIKSLGKKLEMSLVSLQKKEFPILRKTYASILNEKLWSEDIEVICEESGYYTLEFIGGIFAANKNKQTFQETIHSLVYDLRFTRVHYKWYKQDNDYTIYGIDSSPDAVLKDD